MMPLWTTATRGLACGWALASVGLPCVAQRVWPMPIVPASGDDIELGLEVLELALGAQPGQPAAFERRDARRIVAAVFEPPEGGKNVPRHRLASQNANNPAHRPVSDFWRAQIERVQGVRPIAARAPNHVG